MRAIVNHLKNLKIDNEMKKRHEENDGGISIDDQHYKMRNIIFICYVDFFGIIWYNKFIKAKSLFIQILHYRGEDLCN